MTFLKIKIKVDKGWHTLSMLSFVLLFISFLSHMHARTNTHITLSCIHVNKEVLSLDVGSEMKIETATCIP